MEFSIHRNILQQIVEEVQETKIHLKTDRRAVIGDGAPSFTQSKSPQSPGVEPGQAIEQTQKSSLKKQTPARGKSCGFESTLDGLAEIHVSGGLFHSDPPRTQGALPAETTSFLTCFAGNTSIQG